MNEIDVTIVNLDDKEYIVLDKIEIDKNMYYFLSNKDDKNDFLIQKQDKSGEYLISLDNKDEFNKALLIFAKSNLKRADYELNPKSWTVYK